VLGTPRAALRPKPLTFTTGNNNNKILRHKCAQRFYPGCGPGAISFARHREMPSIRSMLAPDLPLELSVQDVQKLTSTAAGNAVILDVREPFEREICAIKDSLFVPMRQIPENTSTLPRDRPLLILCHHGARSLRVTQYLRAQGFSNAANIAGGIDAWAREIEPTMAKY
jgi:rhodanese-related sulfurtransferase